jgi:hypothetical protein
MAHYAYLDKNNIVINVIVGKDENDASNNWEVYYGAKRTSYNTRGGVYYIPNTNMPDPDQTKSFRKNYAGIGYSYDKNLDAFIPPKPYLSWLLDTQTCLWQAPVPYPDDGKFYVWNEQTQFWDLVSEN